ncbi:hypothetical protein [Streptomyces sp. NBC_01353]|uniref:hypothetical protein n=1 Tax=Streptomyces sp. NBC_01353 TaxID=2903835 RepID=UPI002E326836|nr:hypothetical protein [Streptomyces sp. NBC_01353]
MDAELAGEAQAAHVGDVGPQHLRVPYVRGVAADRRADARGGEATTSRERAWARAA